jgi:exosortase A-associated hydrolase 1
MKVKETPVVFECEGVQLIGILHIPELPSAAGILGVTAGGLQYRAGCGRQLLSLARTMAAQGTPVMRFDRRGIGDSVGGLPGFEHMEADLRSAIAVFQKNVPELKHVVLYGGCEAASGIMISAYQLSGVKSVILANPWVNDSMHAVVSQRHYYRKLSDPHFWKKLITFQYNLAEYASSFISHNKNRLLNLVPKTHGASKAATKSEVPFQVRMLSGFQKFDGPVLFLKSGLSLISDEFDHLVSSSKAWHKACSRPGVERRELPSGDQTFSTAAARTEVSEAVTDWMFEMNKLTRTDDKPGRA